MVLFQKSAANSDPICTHNFDSFLKRWYTLPRYSIRVAIVFLIPEQKIAT